MTLASSFAEASGLLGPPQPQVWNGPLCDEVTAKPNQQSAIYMFSDCFSSCSSHVFHAFSKLLRVFRMCFLVGVFSGRVICGARRSMKWSLCSSKWKDMWKNGAKTTKRTPNFKWAELTCARWEVLNNRLQLALTSLLLDNAGSQPRCAVRHADTASQLNKTLDITFPSSSTSSKSGSDRARCFTVVQNPHKMTLDPNTCSFPQCREVETISPLFFG